LQPFVKSIAKINDQKHIQKVCNSYGTKVTAENAEALYKEVRQLIFANTPKKFFNTFSKLFQDKAFFVSVMKAIDNAIYNSLRQ